MGNKLHLKCQKCFKELEECTVCKANGKQCRACNSTGYLCIVGGKHGAYWKK